MFFLLGTTGVIVHLLAGDARMRGHPSLKDRLLLILLWQHLVRLAASSRGQVRCVETFKGVSIMRMALEKYLPQSPLVSIHPFLSKRNHE